jgi:hypothetical protein
VIKLDLHLVQRRPGRDIAMVMNAVHAEAERSGALLLAEGLETPEHVRRARAFGATLGQGWHFGAPEPLPAKPAAAADHLAGAAAPAPDAGAGRLAVRHRHRLPPAADRGQGAAHRGLEAARGAGRGGRRRLVGGARHVPGRAVLHPGDPAPLPPAGADGGVRRRARPGHAADAAARRPGGVLKPGDPLLDEWDIAVVGPHFAGTLVARQLPGQETGDDDAQYSFVLSHDRRLAVAVATGLMSRVTPRPSVTRTPS